MDETIARLTVYQVFKTLLERPVENEVELSNVLTVIKQIKNHLPFTLSTRIEELEKALSEKKTMTKKEYDETIGGLPNSCSLGLNINDPSVLIQLSEVYRSLGIEFIETFPLDYLPAQIEVVHYIFHNRMRFARSREVEVLLEKGIIPSIKKIVSCLENKGLTGSFYYKVLRIMLDYFTIEKKLLL